MPAEPPLPSNHHDTETGPTGGGDGVEPDGRTRGDGLVSEQRKELLGTLDCALTVGGKPDFIWFLLPFHLRLFVI